MGRGGGVVGGSSDLLESRGRVNTYHAIKSGVNFWPLSIGLAIKNCERTFLKNI